MLKISLFSLLFCFSIQGFESEEKIYQENAALVLKNTQQYGELPAKEYIKCVCNSVLESSQNWKSKKFSKGVSSYCFELYKSNYLKDPKKTIVRFCYELAKMSEVLLTKRMQTMYIMIHQPIYPGYIFPVEYQNVIQYTHAQEASRLAHTILKNLDR